MNRGWEGRTGGDRLPLDDTQRRQPLGRPDQGRRGGHDQLDVLVCEGGLLGDTLRLRGAKRDTQRASPRRPRRTTWPCAPRSGSWPDRPRAGRSRTRRRCRALLADVRRGAHRAWDEDDLARPGAHCALAEIHVRERRPVDARRAPDLRGRSRPSPRAGTRARRGAVREARCSASARLWYSSQIVLPRFREPEWSMTKTRPASSRWSSRKWLPPPSVPRLPEGPVQPCRLDRRRPLQTDGRLGDLAVDGRVQLLEAGRDRDVDVLSTRSSSSGARVSTVRSVSTRATPQPISTPMAYGTTARSANSTPPIGMP